MSTINSMPASAIALRAVLPVPTSMFVEPDGRFAFAYIRVRSDTGEIVWRWPETQQVAATLQGLGRVVDVSI